MVWTRLAISVVALALALIANVSSARADDVATEIIDRAGPPVTLTRCIVSPAYFSYNANFNLYDRSQHAMIDATIEYRFFDRDSTQIGRTAYTYTPGETLSPQDTGTFNNNSISLNLAEPMSAVSRVTCRIVAAHFTGRLAWKQGQQWDGGPLSPAPRAAAVRSDASATETSIERSPSGPLATSKSAVKFEVEKAWNDAASDGIFVHDALVLHGGEHSSTVRPADFVLTMALANGAQKIYVGMTVAAPSYTKFNSFTQQYVTANQIDPAVDLGRLGSLIVPANTDVRITISFAVPDRVADANSNRLVSVR